MASKRRIRRKQCIGKVRHANFQNALFAKRRMGRKGWGLEPYNCKFCSFVHLGLPPKEINRTEYIGTGSIYRMTIITKEAALGLASTMQSQVRPPWAWEIPLPNSKQLEPGDEEAMEADFVENFDDYRG